MSAQPSDASPRPILFAEKSAKQRSEMKKPAPMAPDQSNVLQLAALTHDAF